MSSVQAAVVTSSDQPMKPSATWLKLLKPEQLKAFDFALKRLMLSGGVGLFSQQGTGKTIIALALLEKLQPKNVLIVAPLTALEPTWARRLDGNNHTLMHYQLLVRDIKMIERIKWDMVIIDESQVTKNRNSGWSRAVRKLRHVPLRLMLSGTPIDKSPIDVWAQMRFIDHRVMGEHFTPFANEYCYRGGYMSHQWLFKQTLLRRFTQTIAPYIYRLSNKFLNLPPVTVTPVPIAMLGKQRVIYNQLESEGIVHLHGHDIIGDLAVTKQIKLEQITGGMVLDEDKCIVEVGHCKERKFHIVRRQVPTPFVVCCRFSHEIEMLRLHLLDHYSRVECIYGGVKQRTQIIDDFQAGKIDVLLVQQRTGGVSIEFTSAHHLIIYSMSHSSIDFDQLIARLYRYGQKHPVQVWLLYVVNSVDEELLANVRTKLTDNQVVLRQFERR